VRPARAGDDPARGYRDMLYVLWQFEGWRCLWRVSVGALLIALVPALAIGGFVAGAYLARDLHELLQVVIGAVVALGPGQWLSRYLWRRAPWRTLVEDRLWSYERPDPPGDLNAMIRRADFIAAARALRRAKLNPVGGTQIPAAASGVPDLDLKLIVHRSTRWHPPDSPELYLQIRDCLRAAKLRANVASEELFP
jgi:hypothetical protein